MRFKFLYLILFLGVLCFPSCSKYEEIKITDISGIQIKGFEDNALRVSLSMKVENPSLSHIKITDLDTRLYLNSDYIGKVIYDKTIVLPPKSNKVHELDLRIRVANFFGTALKMMSLKSGQKVKVRLEGRISARTWLMKKEIPIDESHELVI